MKKRSYFDLLIIFLLGLIPLLWFKGGMVIAGHDAGLPLDSMAHFKDRLWIWSQRFSMGTDQSFALMGAFFIHGLEALVSFLSSSLQRQQKILFIFWFVLPGLTMYFLASRLWKKKTYLPLLASVLYMINFFLLQGWFIAERTKFSIYAALPLVIYFTIAFFEKKISLKKSVGGIGLTLFFLNGGGSFPLYGGLMIAVLTTIFYFNIVKLSKEYLKKTLLFCLANLAVYSLLNAYWLIPYLFYVLSFYSRDVALAGGSGGALGWAQVISQDTSFVNLLRLQGIPDWYSNPFHAYSNIFLDQSLPIIASFLLPLTAFASLLLIRKKEDKRYILLFSLMALAGMVLTAGPRPPLGFVYTALIRYLPGFIIFRTPFYKFGYSLYFAYAFLIGFTLDGVFSFLEKKLTKKINLRMIFQKTVLLSFIALYLAYHFPILSGDFFDYYQKEGDLRRTRVEVPDYIFEFGNWIKSQDPAKRYLMLPPLARQSFVVYDWGYWSLASVTSLLSRHSFVRNSLLTTEQQRILIEQLYDSFLNDMEGWEDFSKVFAIDGVILTRDLDWRTEEWKTINPLVYEEILKNDPRFFLKKKFGQWEVYELTDRSHSLRVSANSRLSFLEGDLAKVVAFPFLDPSSPIFISGEEKEKNTYYTQEATDVYVTPECIDCQLERRFFSGFQFYQPRLLPRSLFYPIIQFREASTKKKADDFVSELNFYLTSSARRLLEAKQMIDLQVKLGYILPTLKRHAAALEALENLIYQEDWGMNLEEKNAEVMRAWDFLVKQASMIEDIYLESGGREILAPTYEKILALLKYLEERKWLTPDPLEKNYIVDLPRSGGYEIFLKRSTLANPDGDLEQLRLIFRDGEELRASRFSDDWLIFGRINFENLGAHFSLYDTTVENLLADSWPLMEATESGGLKREEEVYTFTTLGKGRCFTFPLRNLKQKDLYQVSFRYRDLTDQSSLSFALKDIEKEEFILQRSDQLLSNRRDWRLHSVVFGAEKPDYDLKFCYFMKSAEETVSQKQTASEFLPGQPIVQVKDISLKNVSLPHLVFYQGRKGPEGEEIALSFSRKNPVKYEIQLAEQDKPFSLILREGFGRFWRVCKPDGGCLATDEKNHFANGGFANAWYFKDGSEGDLVLYYLPQRLYEIGALITLLAFGGVVGWLILRK